MTVDLEEVAVALDAFPHWDAQQRAEVFHAIDTAPSVPIRDQDVERYYFGSPADKAWIRIGGYRLDPERTYMLDEASGYESAPTQEEILKALHRGARMIRD